MEGISRQLKRRLCAFLTQVIGSYHAMLYILPRAWRKFETLVRIIAEWTLLSLMSTWVQNIVPFNCNGVNMFIIHHWLSVTQLSGTCSCKRWRRRKGDPIEWNDELVIWKMFKVFQIFNARKFTGTMHSGHCTMHIFFKFWLKFACRWQTAQII